MIKVSDADGAAMQSASYASTIESYGMIGDCLTGALVSLGGSIDWLCLPRFDSDPCFTSLLGETRHGRWLITPEDAEATITRAYRGSTLILETLFETPRGSVRVTDFMPVGQKASSIIRRVEGVSGGVMMKTELSPRFEFGLATPQVTPLEDEAGWCASVGSNLLVLRTSLPLKECDRSIIGSFEISDTDQVDLVLTWGQSYLPLPDAPDADTTLRETESFWQGWATRCSYDGEWKQFVVRSLLTLKALTYMPTGGLVAALTTSLPEQLGGKLNWDYRYCWLRDATLTLIVFLENGYEDEGRSFHHWLKRAVAGVPEELQIMYGIAGERRLTEWSPAWLPGYQDAAPVRVGNAASKQLQLDVFGEVMNVLSVAHDHGLTEARDGWEQHAAFMEHLIEVWEEPDAGIWEMRGDPRHFTHSKMMAWVALDRAIRCCEADGLTAPLKRWCEARDRIHADVCMKGFDAGRHCFTQSYGSHDLDASLLLMPRLGFLPPEDSRVIGTIAAIEQDLLVDGFLLRYQPSSVSGDHEGAFLTCSFWLVDAYALQGRHQDARAMFTRLINVCNDLGLLAEEYDTAARRQVGNVPQALSHLSLINSALLLRNVPI